jgi:hypothetical protein
MTKLDSWDAAARARVSDRWAKASADWNKAMTDALLAAAALPIRWCWTWRLGPETPH